MEDQESFVFQPYPFTYYVQSPSTVSLANSAEIRHPTQEDNQSAVFHSSPTPSEANLINKNAELTRFTLSHYSYSRGSENSVDNEKKIGGGGGFNRLVIVNGDDKEEEDDDDEEEFFYGKNRGLWWSYCSFRRSNSCAWISLQISWRLLLSLAVALLVFYTATKPPPPKVSIQVNGVREFGLGEGVDASGVTTKILTCNFSINLLIENKSKLFGLHIHPPSMEINFGRMPFASSHGPKLYAETFGSTLYELYVGTRNKPMYGAGRNMQDMLESGMGLPLVIRVKLSSNFRVVWSLIKPKFHHKAECLLVLDGMYDKEHRTQK